MGCIRMRVFMGLDNTHGEFFIRIYLLCYLEIQGLSTENSCEQTVRST